MNILICPQIRCKSWFWMVLIRIPQFWHCSSCFLAREGRSISGCARGPDSFQFLFLFSPSLLRRVAVIATTCGKKQAGLIIWRLIFLAPVEFSNNSHTWHQRHAHLYKSQLFDNTGGYFYCGESFTLKVFYHTSLLLPSRRAQSCHLKLL